eukprot:gnl/Spiro4/8962_TR4729_c0_g1_i1.p1 gnl/Spiro4/8962_TR4729_c0_g1~~gnl/Spiro4/8962_TR4729_c0_g1_i1.p1  ORF type:complete len:276 (+),score=40.71 gnl/Spiro4/8962_TR4729_c0_g1_i1:31-858(+)
MNNKPKKKPSGAGRAQHQAERHPKTKPAMLPSSNWLQMKDSIKQQDEAKSKKRKISKVSKEPRENSHKKMRVASNPQPIVHTDLSGPSCPIFNLNLLTHCVAMDCEMVGVGPGATRSALARASIVNYKGDVILDTYVSVPEKITDYRTWVSGIRPHDLVGAPSLATVQQQVAEILKGRVLIGHSLNNDLQALLMDHPRKMIRDTARYNPLRRNHRPQALKTLARSELGLSIQSGEHSSVQDAQTVMAIYRKHRNEWERQHMRAATSFRKKAPAKT